MSVGEGPRPREKQTPQCGGSLLGCGQQEPQGRGGASAGTQAAHAAREPSWDRLPRVHSLTIRHVLPGRFWHLWSPPAHPHNGACTTLTSPSPEGLRGCSPAVWCLLPPLLS